LINDTSTTAASLHTNNSILHTKNPAKLIRSNFFVFLALSSSALACCVRISRLCFAYYSISPVLPASPVALAFLCFFVLLDQYTRYFGFFFSVFCLSAKITPHTYPKQRNRTFDMLPGLLLCVTLLLAHNFGFSNKFPPPSSFPAPFIEVRLSGLCYSCCAFLVLVQNNDRYLIICTISACLCVYRALFFLLRCAVLCFCVFCARFR